MKQRESWLIASALILPLGLLAMASFGRRE